MVRKSNNHGAEFMKMSRRIEKSLLSKINSKIGNNKFWFINIRVEY